MQSFIDVEYLLVYLVIRLHQLWDRRRSIFYVLISAMAVTHMASFCLSVAAIQRFFGKSYAQPVLS